ncbi:hypothetical protein [Tardiphaga sp.]|jgi:hypothetical protein|uniref:hypothetical protein n=1 Tax=Tardiphaga sp. TaxID=1926292 RepID=UPI0037DA29EA
MGKAARNELRKMKASWHNTVSTAFITVGILGPAIARLFGALSGPIDVSLSIVGSMICLAVSATLHFAGRAELMELED